MMRLNMARAGYERSEAERGRVVALPGEGLLNPDTASGNCLYPDHFNQVLDLFELRVPGDETRLMFDGGSEGKAIRIGNAEFSLIFGRLENQYSFGTGRISIPNRSTAARHSIFFWSPKARLVM